ncbi:restriction endonuclease subunit S [Chryseobacterium sp. MFBS3-17]|uniref:restriction endonuclease subunit S n=1 Tax=Chryseobacterium sp. MFBS3-17 TaxID=2886689 RepID=UPI001D0E3029|nr:restriction endonuclease subunit S [Chryseobacterium sp. MFBS3-17]MCC2591619.1 restriction endonuclease subunit S [Chryseobacterium sp. MFBS3-17]
MENSNWNSDKLGSVIEIKYGKDHKKLSEGNFPCLGSGGIMRYVDSYLYDDESILIPRKGSLNNIMFQDSPFWTVDTMFWSKIDKSKVFPKYLFYQLTLIDYENLNVGSAVPSLTVPVINEIEIQLPPLPEQKAIASVLSSLDDKIDLLHQQNQTLEALAETLFRQWFIEGENEKRVIYNLHDLVDSVSVKHDFLKNELIFLNTSDILKGNILHNNYSSVKDLPGQAKKSIQRKDILFSEIRPANGRWAFVDFDADDFVVSTKLMVLRSKGILSPEFLYLYLTQNYIVNELQLLAEDRSGTFPQITFDILKKFEISFSSEQLMQQANEYSVSFLTKISENQQQIQTLTQLRDTLLPKLMSGEVRVKL